MRTTGKIRFLTIFTLALLLWVSAVQAELSASLSRNQVSIGTSFQLDITADRSPDADPDFSGLNQDFEIPNQSQSQNIQMINGNISRNISWNITLMARRTGTLTIPAIPFGKESTRALSVEVMEADPGQDGVADDDIFLEVETAPGKIHVNQQLLLTIKLFRAVNTDNARLSPPRADDPDIIIRKLGEDDQYETRVDGRRYLVIERRYALFPQRSGTLTLAPVVFQGEVALPGSRGQNLFGIPFRGRGQPAQTRRIQSDSIRLTIRPRPGKAASGSWLPSSNLQLVENWGGIEPSFQAGEPVTRTLMLFADGLTAAQLPALDLQLPEGLKQYPDQPVLRDRESNTGITGIRQEKIAIVPSRAGDYTLPAISLEWWNTETGKLQRATLPERRIHVSAAASNRPYPPPLTRKPVAEQSDEETSPTETILEANPYLLAVALFLALGWLLTAFAWWRRRRPRSIKPEVKIKSGAEQKAVKRAAEVLRKKCMSGDQEAAANALLEWARLHNPESPPRSLGILAGQYAGSDIGQEIRRLEKNLYAAEKTPWDGKPLWLTISRLATTERESGAATEAIAPLHPR